MSADMQLSGSPGRSGSPPRYDEAGLIAKRAADDECSRSQPGCSDTSLRTSFTSKTSGPGPSWRTVRLSHIQSEGGTCDDGTFGMQPRGFFTWSPCAKCCSICCCLSFLVIVIMLPVTNYLIIPRIAQSKINDCELALENVTLDLPPNYSQTGGDVPFSGTIVLDNLGTGAKLHAFRAFLTASNGDQLGFFSFPTMTPTPSRHRFRFNSTLRDGSIDAVVAFAKQIDTTAVGVPIVLSGKPSFTLFIFSSQPTLEYSLHCIEDHESSNAGQVNPQMVTCGKSRKSKSAVKMISSTVPHIAAPHEMSYCDNEKCGSRCRCADQKCHGPLVDCLDHNICSPAAHCFFDCPCSDGDMCMGACSSYFPSDWTFTLLSCISQNCDGHTTQIA